MFVEIISMKIFKGLQKLLKNFEKEKHGYSLIFSHFNNSIS